MNDNHGHLDKDAHLQRTLPECPKPGKVLGLSAGLEHQGPAALRRRGLSPPLAGGGLGPRLAAIDDMMNAIVLHDLTLGYDGHPAVHHLSGVFEPGSMTAVVGPNGSGKSTLLKGITGILRPLGGRIERGSLKDIPDRLPAAAGGDRPEFSDHGSGSRGPGALACASACSAG